MNTEPVDVLLAEREETHGHIDDNAEAFARLLDAVNIYDVPRPLRYAMIGMLLKIARISSGRGDFIGHYEDIEGYAALAVQQLRE